MISWLRPAFAFSLGIDSEALESDETTDNKPSTTFSNGGMKMRNTAKIMTILTMLVLMFAGMALTQVAVTLTSLNTTAACHRGDTVTIERTTANAGHMIISMKRNPGDVIWHQFSANR